VASRHGLRKNFVVEQALREKLEPLRAALCFEEAQRTAGRFIPLVENGGGMIPSY